MHSAVRSSFFAVAALTATITTDINGARAQVACGDNVVASVAMTTDLACATNPGFSVGSGGKVDMAGHQLSACGGCNGVALTGPGAKLSNGSIIGGGPFTAGVSSAGGGNQIENVTITNVDWAFLISGDSNKIKNCTALASVQGFDVAGNKNSISRCYSRSSTSQNFIVSGDGNKFTGNVSANASFAASGIEIHGNSNKLSLNASTSDNAGIAFSVIGNENKLSLNTVTGSNGVGLWVVGNENKISKSLATGIANAAIVAQGDANKLSKNASFSNSWNGIVVFGIGNSVSGSNSNSNLGAGIWVDVGDATSIKSNVTMSNTLNGILVMPGATNSAVSKNIAVGNTGDDLQDDNANCGTNVWANNVFRTSNANGVSGHPCVQ